MSERRTPDAQRGALQRARQALRRRRCRCRPRSRYRARRVLRPAGTERRRQDDHHRGSGGAARAGRRRGPGAGPALGDGWRRPAPAARDSLAGISVRRKAVGSRDARPLSLLLRGGSRRGRRARAARTGGQGEHLGEPAVRRSATADGDRLLAGREAGRAVPGRADHRARSAGTPAGLGDRGPVPRARRHGAVDDPLHGRGRGAVGSRGRHRQRAGHRLRTAPRARVHPGGGARHRLRARPGSR